MRTVSLRDYGEVNGDGQADGERDPWVFVEERNQDSAEDDERGDKVLAEDIEQDGEHGAAAGIDAADDLAATGSVVKLGVEAEIVLKCLVANLVFDACYGFEQIVVVKGTDGAGEDRGGQDQQGGS